MVHQAECHLAHPIYPLKDEPVTVGLYALCVLSSATHKTFARLRFCIQSLPHTVSR